MTWTKEEHEAAKRETERNYMLPLVTQREMLAEIERLNATITQANNALFDVAPDIEDAEHLIECHADKLSEAYRRLTKGAAAAWRILSAVVVSMAEPAPCLDSHCEHPAHVSLGQILTRSEAHRELLALGMTGEVAADYLDDAALWLAKGPMALAYPGAWPIIEAYQRHAAPKDPLAGLPAEERDRILVLAIAAEAETGLRSTAPWARKQARDATIAREVAAYHARLPVNSIGTCSRCGYYGPGPAHDCPALTPAEEAEIIAGAPGQNGPGQTPIGRPLADVLAEIDERTAGPGPLAGDGELLRRCAEEIRRLRADASRPGLIARVIAPIVAAQSTSWPVYSILQKLADAADHLLRGHGCDRHGYEEVEAARDAAREILAATGIEAGRFTARFAVDERCASARASRGETAADPAREAALLRRHDSFHPATRPLYEGVIDEVTRVDFSPGSLASGSATEDRAIDGAKGSAK